MRENNEDKVEPQFSPYVIGKRGISPHDEELKKLYPKLYTAIMPSYDAKSRLTREAGQLRVTVDGGLFKVVLTCPSEGSQCTILMTSLLSLFDELESQAMDHPEIWVETYDSKKRTGRGLKKRLES